MNANSNQRAPIKLAPAMNSPPRRKCGASRFKLNSISPDDFPEAPAAAESFTPIPREV